MIRIEEQTDHREPTSGLAAGKSGLRHSIWVALTAAIAVFVWALPVVAIAGMDGSNDHPLDGAVIPAAFLIAAVTSILAGFALKLHFDGRPLGPLMTVAMVFIALALVDGPSASDGLNFVMTGVGYAYIALAMSLVTHDPGRRARRP